MTGMPHDPSAGSEDPLGRLESTARQPTGARLGFQEQLADCDRRLVEVGGMVANKIEPVTQAFLDADGHAARQAIASHGAIDARCVDLEEACYVLIARQSPVAGDLRRVVAVLHSVADVQRSGALLRHVAEALAWVHPPSMPSELRDTVGQMGTVSAEVFRGAVEAWRAHDGLAANELEAHDDQVDLLQKVLLTELYTGKQSVEEAVSLALIARYYERIADHAVEIARQVAYFLTGDRLGSSSP